ncbi:MAG: hypothetical protein JJU29_14400 [Verrucomicrobia bacterium]|nr:hypothetical protein [Verrucomicrobiota bacterium]MCH8513294.1 hypothetical protein [Kiritimatiellia bacterium]
MEVGQDKRDGIGMGAKQLHELVGKKTKANQRKRHKNTACGTVSIQDGMSGSQTKPQDHQQKKAQEVENP